MRRLVAFTFLVVLAVQYAPAQIVPDAAFARLLNVEQFAVGGVGFAGITSEGEKDFKILLDSPDPLRYFNRLYVQANPQGQAYALLALSKVDPQAFSKVSASSNMTRVSTFRGCVIGSEPLARVVKEISAGDYDWFFEQRRRKSDLPCVYSGPLVRDFSGALIKYKDSELRSRIISQADLDAVAQRTRAKGNVFVDVVVGRDGRVVCAKAMTGPAILREPVERAVRQWTFAPAQMDGETAGYTGTFAFWLCNLNCGQSGAHVSLVQ